MAFLGANTLIMVQQVLKNTIKKDFLEGLGVVKRRDAALLVAET
jgi:hypothetical protein